MLVLGLKKFCLKNASIRNFGTLLKGYHINKSCLQSSCLPGLTFNPHGKRNYAQINPSNSKEVYVNARFLRLGEIDTLKEKFNADVLLTVRWKADEVEKALIDESLNIKTDKLWDPEIYVNNTVDGLKGVHSNIESIMKCNELWVSQRIRLNGNFLEHMELQEFPFDLQNLSINIMSSKSVKILDDPDIIHRVNLEDFADKSEWHLYNYVTSEMLILKPDLAEPDIEVPTLRIKCKVSRKSKFYLYNVFLVSFLIGILAFATFAVKSPKVENRLQLVFILMLALITLRMSFNSTLPRIAYLTFLDKQILMSMISIALICLWHTSVAMTSMASESTILKKNDHIAGLAILTLYGLFHLKFAFQVGRSSLKNWRQMKFAEKHYISNLKKP